MGAPQPLVYLVDDDAAVRKALGRLIASAGYRVQAFGTAREFLDRGDSEDGPACVVLDVRLGDLDGLDVQRELGIADSIMPIVFITGRGDVPTSVRAMKAGATDFLTKPVRDADLLSAIEQALSRAEKARAERAEIDAIRKCLDSLTPREREVMALVVSGRLNKQIALELGTVEKTVKVHRARVMEKMRAASLADLVRITGKVGIPRPADRQGR